MGIAIDVANGLEYLHEGCPVQVVHCDLKPQNVLLDNDMVAHVADFGIGKLISGDKPRGHVTTTTAFLRGSVGYIPPGMHLITLHKSPILCFIILFNLLGTVSDLPSNLRSK